MKKDVVGMDRPRSEEELADLAWIRQSEVLSDLERRVARLEGILKAWGDEQAEYYERVARLKSAMSEVIQEQQALFSDIRNDRERVARLEKLFEQVDTKCDQLSGYLDVLEHTKPEILPWGDLD